MADLWTYSGSIIEEWTVHSMGSGTFGLSNAQTGLCLDNTGGSQSPRNPRTLWGCASNSNQNWHFLDRRNAVYELLNQSSGTSFLDDWLASNPPERNSKLIPVTVRPLRPSPCTTALLPAPRDTPIAAENGTCSFSGQKNVAFGVNGAFGFKAFTNSTSCTVSAFGNSDPAPGFVKGCFYQTSAVAPGIHLLRG